MKLKSLMVVLSVLFLGACGGTTGIKAPGTVAVEAPASAPTATELEKKKQELEVYIVETRAWLYSLYAQTQSNYDNQVWSYEKASYVARALAKIDIGLDTMDEYLGTGDIDAASLQRDIIVKIVTEVQRAVAQKAEGN